MADKPQGLPTMPGTMQVRAGDTIDDLADTAPLQPTVVPTSAAGVAHPIPGVSKPPAMPPEWRYSIKVEIARGGMGRVVEADDNVLGRVVALKEALSRDPDSIRRFERETRITARLEHPAIVPVHDAGVSPDGAPFYVMRKISGRPLEDLVATRASLAQRLELLPNIVAAAHAIAHAHERGVVHRDIKPANILVGDLGETIVIDWGLAKALDESDDSHANLHPSAAHPIIGDDNVAKTRAGIVYGTPGFMSPEQLRGKPIDETSDVYALGATLYHLLARRPPHYAQSADAMMHAAVAGPSQPLREAEPGVPRELATIVDKALAHDSHQRYRNARSLAEDLQRFLTGQLVASHHYSPREKLVRFVRRNRAAVGIASAATLAMVVGAWLAIGRIVDARDHAAESARIAQQEKADAEAEREKATANFNRLTIVDAREKTQLDATRAVAMIKPLAGDASAWRAARAIGAAARASGVAIGLPASNKTLSLELSHDGKRALSTGDDGVVRVYDLAKRETHEVWHASVPASARFGDGGRAIVVASGDALTIVDASSGRTREVKVGAPISALAMSGPIAYWIGDRGSLWRLDIVGAGATASRVALDDAIVQIAPSPDGRWIVAASATQLVLLDRTQPTLPPQELGLGVTHTIAWSADGTRVAALMDDDILVFELPSGTVMRRQTVGARYELAFVGEQLFTTGPVGVTVISRDDPHARHVDGDFELGLRATSHGVVAGGAQGAIAVISQDDAHVLHAPGIRLQAIDASPNAPWVIAASDGELLVWDLDEIEPKRFSPTPSSARFVTADAVIVSYDGEPGRWIDLRNDKTVQLPSFANGMRAVVPAPDGESALVIDGEHHAAIVSPAAPARDLVGDIGLGAFVDNGRVVVALDNGVIRLDETSGSRALTQPLGPVVALAVRDGTLAAARAGSLWRTKLAAPHDETMTIEGTPIALALARGPDVIFAIDNTLRVWRADGSLAVLATLDKPIDQLHVIEPEATRAIAITRDGATRVIDLAHASPAKRPSAVALAAAVADVGPIASITPEGVLAIVDPEVGESWTLAAARGRAFSAAQISRDGRRVLAITGAGLLVWRLDGPDSAADTARWLDAMTNAIVGPDGASAPLAWR